jgi:hypothetical protein
VQAAEIGKWRALVLPSYVQKCPGCGRENFVMRGVTRGWPDFVMFHPQRRLGPIVRELKLKGTRRRVSPAQEYILLDGLMMGWNTGVWIDEQRDEIYDYLLGNTDDCPPSAVDLAELQARLTGGDRVR